MVLKMIQWEHTNPSPAVCIQKAHSHGPIAIHVTSACIIVWYMHSMFSTFFHNKWRWIEIVSILHSFIHTL